ncbi:hypothetical protein Dimus_022158 [Dionaea muscipula]
MVYYKNPISMSLAGSCSKSRQNNQVNKNRRVPNCSNYQKVPDCERSRSAVVDVVILTAVIGALSFLVYPYFMFTYIKTVEIVGSVMPVVKEEVYENSVIYGSLGFSLLCLTMAAWTIVSYMGRKCSNPHCRGLRKAAEFDIQLETEECVKNSNSVAKDRVKMGLFELPKDRHRELETELKKMAPPNGRAILIYRARCGCSVGKMEVPGPKKAKKMKK